MKKIRVLHIVPKLDIGGIDSMLYNYFLEIKKYEIEWDFVVHGNEEGNIEKKLKEMKCNVYHLPPKKENFYKYIMLLKKIIVDGNYDIVHAHQSNLSFIPLCIAKMCGIKIRIAHSHTCLGQNHSIKDKIYIFLNNHYATNLAFCGVQAGMWAFGKKMKGFWIKNGLDINKFKFSEVDRINLRKEYNIQHNDIILGMVCRLSPEKNIPYVLKILKFLVSQEKKEDKKYKLYIVGDGYLYEDLINLVSEMGISKRVFFLGRKDDVYKYYSFFDIFLLPSLYEGFPVSLIEAQCSDLYAVVSKTISNETFFNSNIYTSDIGNEDIANWAKIISNYTQNKREFNTDLNQFDITILAKELYDYYCQLLNKC